MVLISGVSSYPELKLYRKRYPKTRGDGKLVPVSRSSSYLGFKLSRLYCSYF